MAAIKIKNDSWANLLTGMGTNKDPRTSTTISSRTFLTEMELIQLYTDNGFAKKIVNRYVTDMLRERFTINGDDDNLIITKLDEIGAWKQLEKLLRWNRLFGGAVCVMRIDDGGKLDKPLNLETIKTVEMLRVYDRYRVSWTQSDLYNDPNNKNYGDVEYYWISPINGLKFRIHKTRCLVLDGEDIPDYARQLNRGWGTSFIQQCFDQLQDVGTMYPALSAIIDSFITGTITMQNLTEMLVAGKEDVVKARLNLLDLSKHILNTLLLDERETFDKKASTVSGLSDLVDKFLQALSVVSNMPLRILLGQQSGGLNNTGEGETRDWYDQIAADQTFTLSPVIEKLVKIIMLAKQDGFNGIELDDWFIEFNPLWQMSDKETAENRKLNAESDNLYISNGTLYPHEVAVSRFGNAKYGNNITIEEKREAPNELTQPTPVESNVTNVTNNLNKLKNTGEKI